MKRLSKHKFVTTTLPKHNCITIGGRHAAIYHFGGYINEVCKHEDCKDCLEIRDIINELAEVDVGFRREWQKLSARYARVPQAQSRRAEYRRKRGKNF